MSARPDSDAQGCNQWTEGRPGDGVLVMDMRGWRPPLTFRVVDGSPDRMGIDGNGSHRFTSRADVPLLRAQALTSPCNGDGHYECRRCIFWRAPPDGARGSGT